MKLIKSKQKMTKWMIAVIIIATLSFVVMNRVNAFRDRISTQQGPIEQEYIVERSMIEKTITGSGNIQPKDLRMVISDRFGKISEIYVKTGEKVQKDQILASFTLDNDEELDRIQLKNADLAYRRSLATLNDLRNTNEQLRVLATSDGLIKLDIEVGDTVSFNQKIGEIKEIDTIRFQSYFTKDQIEYIQIGDALEVFLPDHILTLEGLVTDLSNEPVPFGSGSLGFLVKGVVSYPGALSPGIQARLTVLNEENTYISPFIGEVIPNQNTVIMAPYGGTVKEVNVVSNQKIEKGVQIIRLDNQELTLNINQQEIVVEQRRLELDQLKQEQAFVQASMSGTLLDVLTTDNTFVDRGTPLFRIADLEKMEVKIPVDELDIKSISLGQLATILSDVFENQEFQGEVSKIALLGNNQGGVTTFEVTIDVLEHEGFMSGMNVDVQILVSEEENALIVPIEAVSKIGGKYIVFKRNEMEKFPVTVEVGIITDSKVQVLSGLNEGDIIVYEVDSNTQAITMGGPFGRR